MNRTVLLLILTGAICITSLNAQTLDKEIPVIAGKLAKTLVEKKRKKVATVDFVDLQGRPTELGRFLAEQLSVELVNVEGISVVDRANIKIILAEHKLTEEGLVKPENAKKLGEFAGVDAILIGTVTSLDERIFLTVKAVLTDTAEVVAAAKTTFQKTREIQQLLVHGVAGGQAASSPPGGSADTEAIATKDLGDLRVALMSIKTVKLTANWGETKLGVRLVLKFTNRNLKESISFAANKIHPNMFATETFDRSKLIDSSGTVWVVSERQGLSAACVLGGGSPATIAYVIMHGQNATESGLTQSGPQNWIGHLTTLPPGEETSATITFEQENQSVNARVSTVGDKWDYEAELVVGVGAGRSGNYRLHNLMWNQLTIPKGNN